MKYQFTIIIPHKNIPHLLQRCLDSIPQRDDLQIIIVDDKSDPEQVDFDKFPGLNDTRCEVIFTKEGKGAGYARNIALSKADSKWVLFADADDYYSDKFNAFLDKYKEADFQTVYFCNGCVDNETLFPYEKDKFVEQLLHECKIKGNMDPLRYKAYTPWTKMTKLSLIREHGLLYEELPAANDSLFNVKVGHYADYFDICKDEIYIRTIRNGSLFYSLDKRKLLARLECGYHVNEFLKSIGKLEEYHSETWGHFLDLRKISLWVFVRTIPVYFWRTPWFIIKKHLFYILKKNFSKEKNID